MASPLAPVGSLLQAAGVAAKKLPVPKASAYRGEAYLEGWYKRNRVTKVIEVSGRVRDKRPGNSHLTMVEFHIPKPGGGEHTGLTFYSDVGGGRFHFTRRYRGTPKLKLFLFHRSGSQIITRGGGSPGHTLYFSAPDLLEQLASQAGATELILDLELKEPEIEDGSDFYDL